MDHLSIVRYGSGRSEATFTVAQLLAAKGVRGWGYRQVWPHAQWQLESELVLQPHSLSALPEIRGWKQRLASETAKIPDNHQTFEVQVGNAPGQLSLFRKILTVFVMFHDGRVIMGLRAYPDSVSGTQTIDIEPLEVPRG